MLEVGNEAPYFETADHEGRLVKSSDFVNKKFVLYFYPKDDTPGCTKEACAFRDNYAELKKLGVEVLGIGVGNIDAHKKFVEKYELPFRLLVDDDHRIAEAYKAWGEKNMFGKKYMGIKRISYIINKNSKIEKTYPKVSPDKHASDILSYLQGSS